VKGVIRSRKLKTVEQHNGQRKTGQTMIYKTLHGKLKIELHEPYKIPGVNSGALEGLSIPASLVTLSCYT